MGRESGCGWAGGQEEGWLLVPAWAGDPWGEIAWADHHLWSMVLCLVVSRLPRVLGDLHILPRGPCRKLEGLLPRERAGAVQTPPTSCLGQGREALGHEGWGGEGGGAEMDFPGAGRVCAGLQSHPGAGALWAVGGGARSTRVLPHIHTGIPEGQCSSAGGCLGGLPGSKEDPRMWGWSALPDCSCLG